MIFACGEKVILPEPVFIENCDGIVTYDCEIVGHPGVDCGDFEFPEGDTDICFSAEDACGNPAEVCITITVEPCEQEGCTYTQGYWQTHSIYGPAPYDPTWALIGEDAPFYYSGQSYYEAIWTPPSGGNAYYILAHQFIAAELNFLNGASPTAVLAAFDAAQLLFNDPVNTPAYVKKLKKTNPALRQYWIDLAEILDDYNNGDIGPGHCEDEGDRSADELTGIINTEKNIGISAYPNPFMDEVTIEFTMDEDTDVVLEIYNMTGVKVASLYNGAVNANQTYSFKFDAVTRMKQETFMYVLRAGTTVKIGRLIMIK